MSRDAKYCRFSDTYGLRHTFLRFFGYNKQNGTATPKCYNPILLFNVLQQSRGFFSALDYFADFFIRCVRKHKRE